MGGVWRRFYGTLAVSLCWTERGAAATPDKRSRTHLRQRTARYVLFDLPFYQLAASTKQRNVYTLAVLGRFATRGDSRSPLDTVSPPSQMVFESQRVRGL